MATKKKNTVKETEELKEKAHELVEEAKEKDLVKPVEEAPVEEVKEEPKKEKKSSNKGPKYPVGSLVFVSKDVEADLNGFNLFISQYKKETYTVEAYDENTGVYTLRHLKLLLKLKEGDLLAPNEKSDSQLIRKQY